MAPLLLFGGTFDPITNGHLALIKHVLKRLNIHDVVFIPNKVSPFKRENSASVEDRYNMLKLAIFDEPNYHISTFELESQNEISYTIDTVRHFKSIYKDEIYFVLGSDSVNSFDKWKEAEEISKLVKLVAVSRSGIKIDREIVKRHNMTVIDDFDYLVSATDIRLGKTLDTPYRVIEYIIDKELYFVKKLKDHYSPNRFTHVLETSKLAYRIASIHNLKPHVAYLAGLYHDIAKSLDYDECLKLMDRMGGIYKSFPGETLHQFVGSKLARDIFKVKDREILLSIWFHTTGGPNMSKYDKLLYACDKIEPTRGYDSSHLIKAMEEDIDQGFITVLKENYDFLNSKKIDHHNILADLCYKQYLKENEDE